MSSHRPKLSIGMPVYNGAVYVAAALDSLLAQTFGEFELVISDNASTDDTQAICRDYAARDARIRYDRAAENCGSAGNFNRVFRLARGEYFKWAACDDVCAPTYLERCVALLDDDPSAVWSHARSTHIDQQGKQFSIPALAGVSYTDRAADTPHQRFAAVLLGAGGCLDSYGVMRADVIRQTQLYLPYFGSEKVFIAEMSLRGCYAEVPEVLFFPRIHQSAAGALATVAEQQQYINPHGGRFRWTRLHLLKGYLRALQRAELPVRERLRCAGVLAQYLLQIGKWRSVVGKLLGGRGLAGGQLDLLQSAANETSELSR